MDSGYEELQFSLKNSECAHIPVKLSQKTDVDHSDQRTQTSAWDIANHIQAREAFPTNGLGHFLF